MELTSTAPREKGQVIKAGFGLYKKTIAMVFPFALIISLLSEWSQVHMKQQHVTDLKSMMAAANTPVMHGLTLSSLIVSVIFTAAMIAYLNGVLCRVPIPLGKALWIGVKKFPHIFLASIVAIIFIGICTLALIVPGIIVAINLYFFNYLIVTENESIMSSLLVSHRLVWGNWWRTVGVLLVPFGAYLVSFAIVGIVYKLTTQPGMDVNYISSTLQVIFNTLLSPFAIAIALSQLKDLQVRKGECVK